MSAVVEQQHNFTSVFKCFSRKKFTKWLQRLRGDSWAPFLSNTVIITKALCFITSSYCRFSFTSFLPFFLSILRCAGLLLFILI